MLFMWERGLDLNQRPSGYEPDELPDCSTPRQQHEVYPALLVKSIPLRAAVILHIERGGGDAQKMAADNTNYRRPLSDPR